MSKPYQSPTPPEEEFQPLAVLRLHWKKIFFISAVVIVLIWGIAVVGDAVTSRTGRWVTDKTEYIRQRVVLHAEVLFVREELQLGEGGGGTVVPQVQPGERVGRGQSYALVCASSQDAEVLSQVHGLEQRLRWLQEAARAQHFHALNAEQISKQVDSTFASILKDLDRGAFGNMEEWKGMFLHRSTTMEAVLGRPVDLSGEIARAQTQLDQLRARVVPAAERLAPQSGCYYPAADGLEDTLTPRKLLAEDAARHLGALWAQAEESGGVSQTQGKLVTAFTWYAVARLAAGDAQKLREGARYTVVFPQESAREFGMRVRTIRRDGTQQAYVIFDCDEKDDSIQLLRIAKAEIILRSVDGLSFPSAALRFLEVGEGAERRQARGVYVIRAGKALWREVEVLTEDRRRAVVAWGTQNEAQAVEGDRVTVSGSIQSVKLLEEGRLLITGRDMTIAGEYTNVKPAIPGGPTTVQAMRRPLFEVTLLSGRNLAYEKNGDVLILAGEEISYKEQRGTRLKIHDAVLVEGKVPA